MVLGGAVGNLPDRAFRAGDGFLGGGVVDFVDLQWWPVFNVADAAIVVGAIGLFLLQWQDDDKAGAERRGVREVVPPALDGQRLDRVVALVTACSRSEAAALVDDGAVRRGRRGPSRPGRTGSARATSSSSTLPEAQDGDNGLAPDPAVPVAVVHEDADLMVVDKPAGLVVHPGAGRPDGTLVQGLLARYPEIRAVGEPDRPGIVHRLDKGTSGLLLVARTPAAYEALVAMLAARTVERRYRTLAWGTLAATGMVDAPIARSSRDRTRMAVSVTGQGGPHPLRGRPQLPRAGRP